jgi:hypothetical protein
MAIRTNIARKQARKDQGSVTHTCYALGNDVAQDRQVDSRHAGTWHAACSRHSTARSCGRLMNDRMADRAPGITVTAVSCLAVRCRPSHTLRQHVTSTELLYLRHRTATPVATTTSSAVASSTRLTAACRHPFLDKGEQPRLVVPDAAAPTLRVPCLSHLRQRRAQLFVRPLPLIVEPYLLR